MHAGVPVVSYRVGDVPNIIRNSGLPSFDVGDVSGLVSGARSVLSMPQNALKELRKVLAANIERNYGLDVVANLHFERYRYIYENK